MGHDVSIQELTMLFLLEKDLEIFVDLFVTDFGSILLKALSISNWELSEICLCLSLWSAVISVSRELLLRRYHIMILGLF